MNIKLLGIFVYLIISTVYIAYLFYPNRNFPSQISSSLRSDEAKDTETTLRRAYFVNNNRQEVIGHYENAFSYLPTLRLNYPPEEAQTIIRDQARSSYLEELVHPFRESVFVNGFIPTQAKDAIYIKGRNFDQKITVRYIPSKYSSRIVIGLSTLAFGLVLLKEWGSEIV